MTEGLKKLRAIVDAKGGPSQDDVARRVGVGQQTVSIYLRRLARPAPHVRAAMEREFGIPATDWYSPAEAAIANGTSEGPAESGTSAISDCMTPADRPSRAS